MILHFVFSSILRDHKNLVISSAKWHWPIPEIFLQKHARASCPNKNATDPGKIGVFNKTLSRN
jgi:hypothetical protein